MVQEMRWSYAAISLAMSFRSLESGIAAPVVGLLTDRLGPRKLIFAGAVVTGTSFLLLSRIGSLWSFYAVYLLLSIGFSLTVPVPGWTAVTNWFSRRRGFAMGLLVASIGASGVLIPLISWLIAHYGWRATFVIAGVGMWAIVIPLSLVVRHRPEQYGYLPDGDQPQGVGEEMRRQARQSPIPRRDSGFSARQAIRTPAFWLIALAATASGGALHAVAVHAMPALISVGIPRGTASYIAGLVIVSSVVGRLGFGWLGDRVDKKPLLMISLLLQAMGLVIFAYTQSVAYAIAFLVLFGPGFGGVSTLRLTIQADYFGRQAFGSIQGLMQTVQTTATILSPVFAGWVYDVQGSYQRAWLVLALVVFLSVPLILLARAPGKREVAI